MLQYERYARWLSSKARIAADANEGHPGENTFKRPQDQTVRRPKTVRVRFRIDAPEAPQSIYKPERPCRENKARILFPLEKDSSIHYKPGEPPMHEQQHKLRKSGPDAQSSLSTALPTKGLKRRKNVKVTYPPVHKSSSTPNERSGVFIDHPQSRGPQAPTRSPSNITRQPPNFLLCSGALTEPEPNRRPNQKTFMYGSSTAVPPLYATFIRAPPPSPIPGTTFTVLVGGVVPPEPGDTTQTISPIASTRPALPPISIRPLPPIPKPFVEPPPVTSGHASFGSHPAYSPVHQRRRVPPVSLDEIDYREVITAFLENDDYAFHDAMSSKAIPPFYCN